MKTKGRCKECMDPLALRYPFKKDLCRIGPGGNKMSTEKRKRHEKGLRRLELGAEYHGLLLTAMKGAKAMMDSKYLAL